MAEKKNKFEKASVRGIAKWCFINKPRPKYKKEHELEYSLTLVVPKETGEAFIKEWTPKAKAVKEEAIAEAKPKDKAAIKTECTKLTLPVSKEIDDDGNETGNYLFNLKRNAQYTAKKGADVGKVKNVSIPIFNCAKPPKPISPNVGRGSDLRVSFSMMPYCLPGAGRYGFSGGLEAVQVVNLVAYTGAREASEYGFDADEEGYVGEDPAPDGEEVKGEESDEGGEGAADDADFK